MVWTNRFNADPALAGAIEADEYVKVGNVSATGLSKPIQQTVLEARHGSKIVRDIADGLASFRGQVAHGCVERIPVPNEIPEERMTAEVEGWIVSGKPDRFNSLHLSHGTLLDFKFPNLASFTYSFQRDKGLKPEWVEQSGVYRWLLKKTKNLDIVKTEVKVTLIEWSHRHARRKASQGYPDRPFFNFTLPMTPLDEVEAWIRSRVKAMQAAFLLPDDQLPECSFEERWGQPSKFAVKKDGRKNAIPGGVRETKAEAEAMALSLGKGHYVESRPGEFVRCVDYCAVKKYCRQVARENPEGVDASMI